MFCTQQDESRTKKIRKNGELHEGTWAKGVIKKEEKNQTSPGALFTYRQDQDRQLPRIIWFRGCGVCRRVGSVEIGEEKKISKTGATGSGQATFWGTVAVAGGGACLRYIWVLLSESVS